MNCIDPVGRRQFPHCCRAFEHNPSPPFLLFLHPSLPVSALSPFTWSHFTGTGSACWCIITNLQIMSPLPSLWIIYQRQSGWHLHPSAVKAGFLPSLLKRPWEEALRSNDSDDWADQMWIRTLGNQLILHRVQQSVFSLHLWTFSFQGQWDFTPAAFVSVVSEFLSHSNTVHSSKMYLPQR